MLRKLLTTITSAIKRLISYVTNRFRTNDNGTNNDTVKPFDNNEESYCTNETPENSECEDTDSKTSELIWPFVSTSGEIDIIDDDDAELTEVFHNIGYSDVCEYTQTAKNPGYYSWLRELTKEYVRRGLKSIRELLMALDEDARLAVIDQIEKSRKYAEDMRKRFADYCRLNREEYYNRIRPVSQVHSDVNRVNPSQVPENIQQQNYNIIPSGYCNHSINNTSNLLDIYNEDRRMKGLPKLEEYRQFENSQFRCNAFNDNFDSMRPKYTIDEFIDKWNANRENTEIVCRDEQSLEMKEVELYYFDNNDLSVIYDFVNTANGIACNQKCSDDEKWQYLKTIPMKRVIFTTMRELFEFMDDVYVKCCYLIHSKLAGYVKYTMEYFNKEYFLTSLN